jgi:hypothetical protein
MKKIVLLLCAIMLVSCGGDSDSEISDSDTNNSGSSNTNSVLLRKIEGFEPDGTLKFTEIYTYNSDNFINKIVKTSTDGYVYTHTFNYENGKITKRIQSVSTMTSATNHEFSYENGLIVLMETNSSSNIFFNYNSKGYVSELLNNTGHGEIYTYDSSDNLVKSDSTDGNNIVEYEYDNELNYSKPFFPESYFKITRKSDHNLTKSTGRGGDDVEIFEYKYNSGGLPTERTTKFKNGVIEDVIKFTYN